MSSVPYWTVSSSSTARPIIATQTSYRNAAQAEHRNEWEEVSPVSVDCDADIVSLDGSRTHEDMQILHLSKLLDEAKQENRRFEERVQSLLNQSMTETSSLQSKIRELRQRNKEALAECERTKKENEDAVAALTKKNDAMRATLQQQNQDMQQALEDLNCSSAHAQAELLDVRNSMQVCRQQLTQSSAQLESLRKEQTARMSLTERVAVLEAEMTKLSSQAKSANASISCDESTTLVQEFNKIRALLENCIPERPAGVSSTSMMSSSNKVVSALRKLNSDIHQDAIEPMTESLHECVKKLLGENHEEEDIESLCQLLKTVVARGDSGRHRNASGTMPVSGNRQVSMNNFQSPGSKLIGEEWFAMANSRSVPTNNASSQFRSPMVRTPSTGEPGHPMDGTNREDHSSGSGFEPVVPLELSANRWVPTSTTRKVQPDVDSRELVGRKVKALLNKLTMEKFETISDQIIHWTNKSVNERDGRTLVQVIRLVFEKATDEAARSEMYARLCRKMMDQISPEVQDDGIKNPEGKPIAGGQLFWKYLLNRCQEDFERGWFAKEATAAAAAAKASDDHVTNAANDKKGTEEAELYWDEYYAAQKARRQGLGLIKFIGELFKLQMLTERNMHECVKKLLGNVENPKEEEIESLCQLLKTVGQLLDTQKARAHMDVYFTRMKELGKSLNVNSRMQFMLQDIIELRDSKWVSRNVAAVHELAAKKKAAAEKEYFNRRISMSRGGCRRGDNRNQHGPDGWAVAGGNSVPRAPPKAGYLSQFGKISKGPAMRMVMDPSGIFATGKNDSKRETLSRTNSSSNMFHMLSRNPEFAAEASTKPSRLSGRKLSVNLGHAGVQEPAVQRRKLQLLPRSFLAYEKDATTPSEEEPESMPTAISEADVKKKIDEDVKEFFAVRNLQEAEVHLTNLSDEHRSQLVDKLVASALESKEADAKLVGDFFAQATSNGQCTLEVIEEGFMPMAEFLDDIAIDAPKAFDYMAIMLRGAGFQNEPERLQRIASKLEDSDKLVFLVA